MSIRFKSLRITANLRNGPWAHPFFWVSATLAVMGTGIGLFAYSQANVPPTANNVVELATVVTGPTSTNNIGSTRNLAPNDEVLWVVYHGGIQPIAETSAPPTIPEIVQGQVDLPSGFKWFNTSPNPNFRAPPNTVFADSTFSTIPVPAADSAISNIYWAQSPYAIAHGTETTSTFEKTVAIDLDDYFQCDPVRTTIRAWDKVRWNTQLPWGATGLREIRLEVQAPLADGSFQTLTPDVFVQPAPRVASSDPSFDIRDLPTTYRRLQLKITFVSNVVLPNTARKTWLDILWKGDPAQTCFTAKAQSGTLGLVNTTEVKLDRFAATDNSNKVRLTAGHSFDSQGEAVGSSGILVATLPPGKTASGAASTALPQTVVFLPQYDLKNLTGDVLAYKIAGNTVVTPPYASASQAVNTKGVQISPGVDNRSDRRIKFIGDAIVGNTAEGFNDKNLYWPDIPTSSTAQPPTPLQSSWGLLPRGKSDIFGDERMRYFRGGTENEGDNGRKFRARQSVLGPVVNSGLAYLPQTSLVAYPADTFTGHRAFRVNTAAIRPSSYVFFGGHDGMLHALKTTTDSVTGITEAFAYAPSALFQSAHSFTNTSNAMLGLNPFAIDSTPMIRDVSLVRYVKGALNSNWHSVVVTSFGRGRRGLFALSLANTGGVTNLDFPSGTVLWEYTNETKAVPPFATGMGANSLRDLGQMVYAPPIDDIAGAEQVVRMSNGRWAAVVGNGINSQIGPDPSSNGTGKAVLYIFYLGDGGQAWQRIPVSESDSELIYNNGLMSPRPVDTNDDGQVDLIYAGDMKGNLWRFDVSSLDGIAPPPPPTKLFKTSDGQPIVAAPVVRRMNANSGCPGCLMVGFGTGYPTGPLTPGPLTLGQQALYGVVDDNKLGLVEASKLLTQTIASVSTTDGTIMRTVSNNAFKSDENKGWKINLEDQEQMFANIKTYSDNCALFTTGRYIAKSAALPKRSWLTQVNLMSGASCAVFGPAGSRVASVGFVGSLYETPAVVPSSPRAETETLLLPLSSGGKPATGVERLKPPKLLGRLSWREIYESFP